MADEEGIMRPQPRPTTELSYSDIEKIERVVWGEARGETVEGRNAIRGVILNRLASGRFGDTIDEVLIGSQFNTIDDHGNGRIENIPVPQEDMEMLMNEAADYYMLGSDASEGRTFYQNEATATGRYEGVDPTQIGSHTFYRGLAGQEPVHDTNFSHNIRIVPDEDVQLAEMNEGGLATADPEEEVGFWGRLFGRGSDASDDEIPVNELSLPMSADPETDIIVGQTEWGSPVYRSQLGEDYWIRPVSQERTYESEAGTWDRAGEIGMTLAEGAVDGLINGFTAPGRALRGETLTYGDALETAGMANVGAMPFTVPEGSLRTFMSGTRPRDGFVPASEETLEALRINHPAAEARGENYQVYERPRRDVLDIEVYPERQMAETPMRPGDPDRGVLLYDPDRAEVRSEPDYVDVDGQQIDISYAQATPTVGSRRLSDLIEPQEDVIYRGMSAEEYQNAMENGYFESRGEYNIGEEQVGLTFFSPNAATAESYSSSFTPFDYLPTPDRPAYVVAIRRPEGIEVDRNGEVGVPGRIPTDQILDVYRGDVYAATPSNLTLMDDWGTQRLSGVRYQPRVAWTRMDDAAPEAQYTLSDFGYMQDNPGGEWLQRKQERAEQEIIDNAEGRFGRGITGSVTGTLGMQQDMFLPTNRLFDLPGLSGEMRRPGDPRFDALLERVREEGFDPNQAGNRVVVAVNHRGEAFLMEGNTRVAVAAELGVPSVRAEVRYWNGGEDVEGPFSPDQTVQMASPTPLGSPESPEGFAKGGLALDQSEALKGITTEAGYEMAQKKPQMDRSRADQDGDGQVSAAEEVAETARRTVGKDDIAEMNCGGIMMPEMEIDPVSGNEVPLGSTPENVRDDIPAMLSQDEYVLPAHVVKWHGLKHIQEMQMEAEAGLMAMAFEGLIGGEDMEEAAVEADEEDTMEDEYVEDMDVEVESPVVEVEDDLEDEAYEEEPETSELPGMVKKQKYAFIIS